MSTHDELACTYSALILVDDDVPITAEKLTTILKAANVQFEPIWPTLFARAVTGVNVKDLLTKIGSAAAAAPAAAPAAAAASAPAAKKEEKKEEKKKEESEEEEDADMGFGLFD
jgi:large subunit ribosomal protein LP1